jgi:hypothetical protein
MKIIRFYIESLSPGMLQNPATGELLESLRTKKPIQTTGRELTIEVDAAKKMYRSDPDPVTKVSCMGIPMQNIMSCMVIAGRYVKSGKKALSTAKDTMIYSFMEFVENFCAFEGCDAEGNIPWNPFPVKGTMHNGASEVAVCINRPRIPHWKTSFTVRFDDTQKVDESTLIELVKTAGRQVGLGDWRPGKRGRFGRFVVKRVEILDAKAVEDKVEIFRYEGELAENAPADLKAVAMG